MCVSYESCMSLYIVNSYSAIFLLVCKCTAWITLSYLHIYLIIFKLQYYAESTPKYVTTCANKYFLLSLHSMVWRVFKIYAGSTGDQGEGDGQDLANDESYKKKKY